MVWLPWIPSKSEQSSSRLALPSGCKAFGALASTSELDSWLLPWRHKSESLSFLLILAGSRTAEVEGISAAGATSLSRRYTALADAELLLNGPRKPPQWPLPPLPAGVSPALISYVASRWIGLDPQVAAVGLFQQPTFPYLCFDSPSFGPAACLSTGRAMNQSRVKALWKKGFQMGRRLQGPLVLAECIPGGTTTAQAVLTGLGLSVDELISSSARTPPIALKQELVNCGLRAAGLGLNPRPQELIAAVGDPFQPLAVGILLGATEGGQPILLGGGGQMLAVLAMALAASQPSMRSKLVERVAIGTTAWLVEETTNSGLMPCALECLINQIQDHFDIGLLGLSTGLRFHSSTKQALRDYELGYVKEGVGAGALSLLAQLRGASCQQLVEGCEEGVDQLQRRSAS